MSAGNEPPRSGAISTTAPTLMGATCLAKRANGDRRVGGALGEPDDITPRGNAHAPTQSRRSGWYGAHCGVATPDPGARAARGGWFEQRRVVPGRYGVRRRRL